MLWELSSAGRASALQAGGHRFDPYSSHQSLKQEQIGSLAQLGEHLPYKQEVIGSIPIAPTKSPDAEAFGFFIFIKGEEI